MELFVNRLTALISVKKIIAILVISVYCGLAIRGTISAEQFSTVGVMIVSFYFGQSTVKQTLKEKED